MNKSQIFINRVQVKISEQLFQRSMNFLSKELSKKGVELTVGTKSINNSLTKSFVLNESNEAKIHNWCVVFQGKIYNLEFLKFLEETLLQIRNRMPNIAIIVATYEDEFFSRLENFCSDHKILTSIVKDAGSLPSPYPQSLCQQIESSHTGLNLAQELGFENSIKIRVDQRIDVLMAILLVSQFFEDYPSRSQQTVNRIWGTSYNTYLHRPLALSDMVQFGKTSDLLKYWKKIGIHDWVDYLHQLQNRYPDKHWYGFAMPETWLAARYLDLMNISLLSPEETNSNFWENYAGVINANVVGQEWKKTYPWLSTNYHTVKWFREVYSSKFLEMRNEDWLIIHYLGSKVRDKGTRITLPY
jgi:hypothetical protein